jgi:hypothetical protein
MLDSTGRPTRLEMEWTTHRLTTKTALLAVITTLTLSVERILTLLVLSDLPFLVVSAVLVLAVSLQFLGKVNHFCKQCSPGSV